MSYTALYRKWRPVSFEDVKGQDPIVQTLKNQITSERIGHAYLFCGTRGTGKTSIAKIYARAVNCEHPVDGSPCNQCPSCKSILAGTSMNVVEIDAASNNGVENIRDIREQVQFFSFQTIFVGFLIVGNCRIRAVQLHPYVAFDIIDIGQYIIPSWRLERFRRLGSIAGKFLYPTVVIEYRIKIGRDKECFPIKGKQTIIDLGILRLCQCVKHL